MEARVVAVLTADFWLSVVIPLVVSIALIVGGRVTRRGFVVAFGVIGLLLTTAYAVFFIRMDAVLTPY